MMESLAETPSTKDVYTGGDVSVVELATALIRNWRIMVSVPLSCVVVAAGVSVLREGMYSATAAFLPVTAEGRATSGAVMLAQQFGVSLGSDGVHSPQLYADLVSSPSILRSVVEAEYELPATNGEAQRGTLIEYYGIGADGSSMPPWRTAVKQLQKNINTRVNRETSIVRIAVQAPHSGVAEQVAAQLLERLDNFNVVVRQQRAENEGRFVARRLQVVAFEVREAEGEIQAFLRQNREFRNAPELQFQYERLSRNVAMLQELQASLMRSLEQGRIEAHRDTPLITVIEGPESTAQPVSRNITLHSSLAFLLGWMIAAFVALTREFRRRSHARQDPRYQEFEMMAKQALNEALAGWRALQGPGSRRTNAASIRRRPGDG
jgi:uncharacterized protein involved in exopolysaccharide biosynthesis